MSYIITSPIEGFTGRSNFGPVMFQFEDGTAEVETLSDPIRDYLERRGYKVEEPAQGGSDSDADGDDFDPTAHTVADVLEYANQARISPADIDRIAALEEKGKARKSLLSDLADRREEIISATEGQQTHDTPEG